MSLSVSLPGSQGRVLCHLEVVGLSEEMSAVRSDQLNHSFENSVWKEKKIDGVLNFRCRHMLSL